VRGCEVRCIESFWLCQQRLKSSLFSNHLSQTLYIIDCRPKVTALGNAISYKGGYESSSYTNCKILFMNIENFRQMRESWQKYISIEIQIKTDQDSLQPKNSCWI
jgi:hypothetical protein